MKSFLLASSVAVALGSEFKEIVRAVNSVNTTWVAEEPTRFGSLDDVMRLCGARLKGDSKYQVVDVPASEYDENPMKDLPVNFDARTHWSNCSIISKIRDQASCGSCWAFSATETFEDSRCIATGEDKEFSTDDTAGCCRSFLCGFSMGCNGGQQLAALGWMTRTGVVTGGGYNDRGSASGGCKPYELAPCAHHVPPSSKYPACPKEEGSISCTKSCSNRAFSGDYSSDKTKGVSHFRVSSVAGMQTALMTTGPLAVAFTVYSDFPTYKSGVYKHTSGTSLGGHAVEFIGWGTENGQDYWLVKNSWNEQWGDGGTFKIARGVNECGIEDDVGGIKFN